MSSSKHSPWSSRQDSTRLSGYFHDTPFVDSAWLQKQCVRAVNVKDDDDAYEIELTAPGFRKQDFTVNAHNSFLYVSAQQSTAPSSRARSNGQNKPDHPSFMKCFHLPMDHVNAKDIKVQYRSGKLKIRVVKKKTSLRASRKNVHIHHRH